MFGANGFNDMMLSEACQAGVEIYQALASAGVDMSDERAVAHAFDDAFGQSGIDPAYAGAAWSAFLGQLDGDGGW